MSQADIRARVVGLQKAKKGEKALKILHIMSYFSSENISAKTFTGLAGGTKELESAVGLLKQYSIVNLSQQDPTMLNISELTQQVIRTMLKEKKEETSTLNHAINLFKRRLKPGNLTYAISIWRYASAYPTFCILFGRFPGDIVQKLGECGRYEEAYSFGIEQVEYLEKRHHSSLLLRYKLGNVLLKQKRFEEALRIYDDPEDCYKDVNVFLRFAAEEGDLEAAKFLAEEKGIDNEICYGKSVLDYAIQGHSLEMIKFLVKKGADFHTQNSLRQTIVHRAIEHGNLDIVKFFVESGADFKTWDDELKTPLHYAAERGNLDVIKLLVENGADVNSTDRHGKTSIHYASEGGSLGMIKYLVANGAVVDSTDNQGMTSLHWAAYIGNLDAVRILIKKGAKVDVIDKNHMTPLDYAIEKLDPVKPIDHRGGTQLHYAVYYGHAQVVKNLLNCVNSNQLHDFITHRTIGGNSALDLAIKADNKMIIKILDKALQEAPYTNVENVSIAGVFQKYLDECEEVKP